MRKILSLLLLTVISFSSACAQSGETRDVDGFTGVAFGVAGKLILEQGNTGEIFITQASPG